MLNRNNSLDELRDSIAKLNNSGYTRDDRFWKAKPNANGNGLFQIRFLDAPEGEDTPVVKYKRHYFRGENGKWFVETCPSTFGLECPVCAAAFSGYKELSDVEKTERRKQLPKERYVSNILIIDDPVNPENNGTVMLFDYGPLIWKMIEEAIAGNEDLKEDPFNPFNYFSGATFNFKMYTEANYLKYDKSYFSECGQLFPDEADMEAVHNKAHSLQDVLNDKREGLEEYTALEAKYNKAQGIVSAPVEPESQDKSEDETPQEVKPETVSEKVEETVDEDIPDNVDTSKIDGELEDLFKGL